MGSRASSLLVVSHSALRTGAPIGLLAFLRWLRATTDHRISVLLRSPGPLEAEFKELGPTLILGASPLHRTRVGRRLRRFLPPLMREEKSKIRRFCAAGAPNLIYSNTITNGATLATLAPIRVPVITHVHELAFWIARAGPENLRQVLAHTTNYVAVAQAVRENLCRNHGIPDEKIRVVYEHIRTLPSVPTAEEKAVARSALGIPSSAFVVGGCGAEHWRKGRDLIPQLLVNLRHLRPDNDIHFVWIGRPGSADEENELYSDLRTAGLESRFHASGELSNPFTLYPAIDVFTLLSRDDPYPLACLEVAATGVPVVCFANAGGMPEFVSDGCGLVAPYLDLWAMARDILRLADDSSLSRTCSQRAREKVAAENTLEATGPQLLAIIEQAIAITT